MILKWTFKHISAVTVWILNWWIVDELGCKQTVMLLTRRWMSKLLVMPYHLDSLRFTLILIWNLIRTNRLRLSHINVHVQILDVVINKTLSIWHYIVLTYLSQSKFSSLFSWSMNISYMTRKWSSKLWLSINILPLFSKLRQILLRISLHRLTFGREIIWAGRSLQWSFQSSLR